MPPSHLALAVLAAAIVSGVAILALWPLLRRYALARPNARSSHRVPTPQGGGIAVIAAALLVAGAGFAAAGGLSGAAVEGLARLALAATALAVIGTIDDIRPLPTPPRLLMQFAAVALVALPAGETRFLAEPVPLWLERGLAVLAGVWFVNLVNFIDGIDWITVAQMVPLTAAVAAFAALGLAPLDAGLVAAALCGALLGFAPFNRPVARLFLGDVGSLPIGLLVAWILHGLATARAGGLAAALLLSLYSVADATLTLVRRGLRGERLWVAHRTHFYQRATDNGFTVTGVSGRVFALNLVLAGLAAAVLAWPQPLVQVAALALGALLVGLLLFRFGQAPASATLAEERS